MITNPIPPLPLPFEVETKRVLKKVAEARAALAELKGVCRTIPNEAILLNTLILQEAKESSAIENIITTHDELFQADSNDSRLQGAVKEVIAYKKALLVGFERVRKEGLIRQATILEIQQELEGNSAGFRRVPGTVLKNDQTGEIVHTPPQDHAEIEALMSNLIAFINESNGLDPLVKMAIIHHQFETIHPFYDGNGRTGRIINILYLVLQGLLDSPVLYLSRYIIRTKSEYYRLLQQVRLQHNTDIWEAWVLYVLDGIQQTAQETIALIGEIAALMARYKEAIRRELPKLYSKDLLENIFKHPYTKIAFVREDLNKSYNAARVCLEQLCAKGFLTKLTLGKENFYLNTPLFQLFTRS